MKMLILTLAATAIASSALADTGDSDKRAFAIAYKEYQQAEQGNQHDLILAAAIKAYELGKHVYKDDPKTLAILAENYALYETDPQKSYEALSHQLSLKAELYAENSIELVDTLLALGKLKGQKEGQFNFGKELKTARNIVLTHYEDNAPEVGSFYLSIGSIALNQGSSTAINWLKKAQAIFRNPANSHLRENLATTEFMIGKYHLANQSYKQATDTFLSSLQKFEDMNHQLTMATHAHLVEVYEQRNLRNEATKHCQAIGKLKPVNDNQDYLPLFRRAPKYPIREAEVSQEGFVVYELTVDKEGFVKNPVIVSSEGGPAFRRSSLEVLTKFRYAPRFENGEPVDTKGVRYKFTYKINT